MELSNESETFNKLVTICHNLNESDHKKGLEEMEKLKSERKNISQDEWDYFMNNYDDYDIPEIFANTFIIKREEWGKITGINILTLFDRDEFS